MTIFVFWVWKFNFKNFEQLPSPFQVAAWHTILPAAMYDGPTVFVFDFNFFFNLGFYNSCLSKYEIICGFYLNSLAGECLEHHARLLLPLFILSKGLLKSFDHFLNWVCSVSVIEFWEFFIYLGMKSFQDI